MVFQSYSVLANSANMIPGIKRKDVAQLFDAKQHLEQGIRLFNVQDYVKSYNLIEDMIE